MSSLPYSPHRSKFKNANKSENRRQILRERALKKTKENRNKIIERLRQSQNADLKINNLSLSTPHNNNNLQNHPSYLDQYTSSADVLANQISDSLFQELSIECHTLGQIPSSDGTPNENFNNLTEDELIYLRESIREELERNILELKEMETQEFLRMQEQATSNGGFFPGTNNSGFLTIDSSNSHLQHQNENFNPFVNNNSSFSSCANNNNQQTQNNNNNTINSPLYCPLCKFGTLQQIFGKILCHKCNSVLVDSGNLDLEGLRLNLRMAFDNHNRINCLDEISFFMRDGVLIGHCEICGFQMTIQ